MRTPVLAGVLMVIAAFITVGVLIGSIGSDDPAEPVHITGYQSDKCYAQWLDSVEPDGSWFVEVNSECGEPLTNIRTFIFYDGVICDAVRTGGAADPNNGPDSNLKGLKCHRSK